MEELLKEIEDNTEWLQMLEEEDEVECISVENLKGILENYNISKKEE